MLLSVHCEVMREINECTAEVFRRSEKRIKERKRNRNRILAFCVPLCLIVTVWSVMILPAMLPASKSNDGAENFMDTAGGTDTAYVRVEVMSTGTATHSTILKEDADEASQIYYTVQSFFVSPGEGDKESAESAEDDALTEENKDYSQSGTTTDLFSGYSDCGVACYPCYSNSDRSI